MTDTGWGTRRRVRGRGRPRLSVAGPALLVGAALLAPGGASTAQEARRTDFVDTVAGIAVPDPYRWMEEMSAPEVREWAEALDAEARAFAAGWPGRDALLERIASAADHVRFQPPVVRGGRWFYTRFNSSFTRVALLVREGENGPDRVLIPEDREAEAGRRLDPQVWPSPSGRWVAYGTGPVGSRWIEVRVMEVETGRVLDDRIRGLVGRRISNLSWSPDEEGFFYDGFEPPEGDLQRARFTGARVAYHRLGTDQARDRTVFAAEDAENHVLSQTLTDDGRHLVVRVRDGRRGGNEVRLFRAEDGFRRGTTLVRGFEHPYGFVGSRGSEIWLSTTRGAPNGRVVGLTPTSSGAPLMREIVPEQDGAIDAWTGARALGGRVVAGYRVGGLLKLRAFEPGGPGREIEMPRLGSIWSGFVGRQDDPRFHFVVSGFADPGTVYVHDLDSGRTEVFREPDLPYDPADVVTRLVYYPTAWGDSIPMYLAHRRGVTLDGTRPVMVYGYGFGRWSASPWFRPHMAEWFAMGGAFALPAIRGGGELGERWHQDGVGRNRQNAIDDFIAASRWLVEEGLASSETLVAETNSAGASVVAAAVQQQPELYAAALYGFPLLDVVRYASFTGGHRWRSELGDPTVAADLEAILAYSPVHNVPDGRCHPPTLVTPGELDETTPPVHAYKFVAATRAAQGCEAPILLRISWGAEHSYGADQERTMANFADQLAFLARVLDAERLRW